MENLKIYEIENSYIDHLVPFAPHLFHNKKENQENERKYIGIILTVNGLDYFAPLSSFKEKHKKMKTNMDFVKVGNYAVINLNNMFPVPKSQCIYVDVSKESDPSYKALLSAEYRIITSLTERILKNAKSLYEYKMKNGNSTPLAKRCNDFTLLEEKCKKYLSSYKDGKLVMRGSLDKRGWLGRSQTWESISQVEVEKLIAEANATYGIK